MKICMVGEGAFAHKHLDALARIEGVEVASIVGGVAEHTQAVAGKYGIPHWTMDLDEGLGPAGGGGGHPRLADAAARLAGRAGDARRQTRAHRDPDGGFVRERRAGDRDTKVHRPDRDGEPRATLQPEPPVDASADPGRGAATSALGSRDLLLPPHQHQRAGPAPELDRPPAVASRLPYGGPVPVPDRRPRRRRSNPAGSAPIPSWASPWT